MASRGINFNDINPKLPKQFTITASADASKLIQIRAKDIPESQVIGRFERAINRASLQIAQDLKDALDAAMASSIWGGNDIIDTGNLMDSGSVTVNQNGVTVAYDAPYAALVHYGGYIHPYGNTSLRVYLPPRPWIESVLYGNGPVPRFDFIQYYTKAILSEFS